MVDARRDNGSENDSDAMREDGLRCGKDTPAERWKNRRWTNKGVRLAGQGPATGLVKQRRCGGSSARFRGVGFGSGISERKPGKEEPGRGVRESEETRGRKGKAREPEAR
jgi:hypothetical protein